MPRTLVAAALVVVCAAGAHADTLTIAATASGSATPTPIYTKPLTNGDFEITTLSSFPIGDGEDDWTTWTLDFTSDPNYSTFSTSTHLANASLTLTLTPVGPNVSSDEIQVIGLAAVGPSEIRTLVPGSGTTTVSLDLLDHYTSAGLLGALSAGSGKLSFESTTTRPSPTLNSSSPPSPSRWRLGPASACSAASPS